jgi:hypothetical protein
MKVINDYESRPQNGHAAPTIHQTMKYMEALNELEDLEAQWNALGYQMTEGALEMAKQEVIQSEVRHTIAKVAAKGSKNLLAQVVKEFKDARKQQHDKPVKEMTEAVMKEFGIWTQPYHSHSLIGEHCHRLLMNHREILKMIQIKWIEYVEERFLVNHGDGLSEDILEQIEKFLADMTDLMEALDFCCSFLATQNYWFSDAEIDEFDSIAKYFGSIWREYLKKSVPPKLHVLEVHAVQFLRQWRNTGNFGEDSVEHNHHFENKYNSLFANRSNWIERKKLIRSRKALTTNSLITSSINKVLQSTSRKRSNNQIDRVFEKRQKR